MTRKDYNAIAAILAGDIAVNGDAPDVALAVANIGRSLADVMARDNPRFDRQRFYAAAGIDPKGGSDHAA